MQLSFTLQKKIIEFLISIPNMDDTDGQRALIFSAGLDSELQDLIQFGKPLAQFVPLFISTLLDYGKLNDGRNPVEAVLEATKNYVGIDKKDYCQELLEELHAHFQRFSEQIDTLKHRTLVEDNLQVKIVSKSENKERIIVNSDQYQNNSIAHYSIEIKQEDNRYIGIIYQNSSIIQYLSNLKLGEDIPISIKGVSYKIGDLIRALIGYDQGDLQLAFDERGQFEIGRYLYLQIFSNLPQEIHALLQKVNEVDIRIITQDEHIARLPWILLANNGIFLVTNGWSISISGKIQTVACELPVSPRVLVIAPQPITLGPTNAKFHIEEIERKFSTGGNLRVACTWKDFNEMIDTFKPQIVYFYGHSIGDIYTTHLFFEDSMNSDEYRKIPASDFALCLRQMEVPPCLVYINGCLTDAGGFMGFGRQLEYFVPAVFSLRTVVRVREAQSQAITILENILAKGMPPHKALTKLCCEMGRLGFSTREIGWMAPVLYRHYDNWYIER